MRVYTEKLLRTVCSLACQSPQAELSWAGRKARCLCPSLLGAKISPTQGSHKSWLISVVPA